MQKKKKHKIDCRCFKHPQIYLRRFNNMKKITNFVLFVFLLVNQYQNVSINKMDEVQKEKVSTFSLVA